ncbi:hypothetical protein [Malaciobacter marinus]|uniref:hypothetical protein n=1 Tax=Malaciobacter marinus TaxID=505249 RepID=UPI003B0053F2
MGNTYNVIEAGVIQCACGGKVTLTSTAKVERIAGAKPLYLKDIIGAPVACPRSKNKCTKVASISTAGTETNVKSTANHFLLRTDGFKTDKGRAVVLKAPGQTTSKIIAPPSIESSVVKEEEPLEEAIKQEEEIKQTEKYSLYLVRKSEDIYRPLRPTRAFLKSDDTYVGKKEFVQIKDNVHVHTFAYVYVIQDDKIQEYKVLSRGTLYSEKLQEIFFENTNTKIKYNYIPIYEQSEITISYSSIRLTNKIDILKLKKQIINPKEPDNKNSFYFEDSNSINKIVLTDDDLKLEKEYKVNEEDKNKRLNILCIIEDILAQIEDMYERYYTNYKLAYAYNDSIIEDIKKQNSYAYTIANMVDYFYVSKDESKTYKNSILQLKKIYNQIVSLFLTDKELIDFLSKNIDISRILEKDKNRVGQSYFQQVKFLKSDFFDKELDDEEKSKILGDVYYSKTNFRTSTKNIKIKYVYLTDEIKRINKHYVSTMKKNGIKAFEFYSNNDDYTQIKQNASHVLANVLFSLLYSQEYENQFENMNVFSKVKEIKNKFFVKLKEIVPKPNISSESIEDIQETVEKQEVYHDMMVKPISIRDKFLGEYENLDFTKRIKSFEQNGEKVKFSSKYLYYDNLKYFQDKSIETPQKILEKIEKQLQNEELKKLLKIYENIKIEDDLNYIVSCMNIVYLLSAPRVYIDEESDKTSFFNEKLNHIYKFVVNLTKRRIALKDEQKDILNLKYQISYAYSQMQIRLILNDIIFSNSKKKALIFIDKFKVSVERYSKTNINYKYIHDNAQNIKSVQREYYETLKNIEGITSNLEKILEEFTKSETKRVSISKALNTHLTSGLKTYGTLIAIANISDYLFFDDSKKNIKNHVGFVKDITEVTVSMGLLISKYPNTPMKVLEFFFKEEAIAKQISQSSKRLLSFIKTKVVVKVAVITIIITTSYDAIKLVKKEDYDALVVTVLSGSLSILLTLTLPSPLGGAIASIAFVAIALGLILEEIKESNLDLYLKKSLLYKTVDFSLWKSLRGIPQDKMYQAPYLFEITNENKDLKTISFDGFSKPKKLINFIGQNYIKHSEYFDTALKNELSFFKSSLFGYKLEETDFKSHQRVKTINGTEISFHVQKALKIPKILADDKEFKLFFSPYKDEYLEISKILLASTDNIFNFFPRENSYFNLNQFTNNIKRQNHKSYIVVLSSQIELKYEVEFTDTDKITPNCNIDIDTLKQISFSVEDEELLKGKNK